jgi:hypothetical protein
MYVETRCTLTVTSLFVMFVMFVMFTHCTLALAPWWFEPLMWDSESHALQRPRLLDLALSGNDISGGLPQISSLLFGSSYTPETAHESWSVSRRTVNQGVAISSCNFRLLFVNTSVLNILPCLSNNSFLILNSRSQDPTNASSKQNPGYVH